MRSLEVSLGKFGGTTVISGSLQSTLLEERELHTHNNNDDGGDDDDDDDNNNNNNSNNVLVFTNKYNDIVMH